MERKNSFLQNYLFLIILISAIILGCIVGAVWPNATMLEPLGTLFINLMFCTVVPLVFVSISNSIANMKSRKRAGKIMGVTIITFLITGAIASVIMVTLMKIFPPVLTPWQNFTNQAVEEQTKISTLIVNFFTASDFPVLISRRSMLPLIIFSILFGFGVNLSGGPETKTAQILSDLSNCLLKMVKIITYYAPIAFFGFFASLVATYGPQLIGDYGRAMAVYYPLCVIYVLVAFPIMAFIGGGPKGPGVMFKHIAKPAFVSLGTCSSVGTIPTNIEVAEETGISKDVSEMVLPLGATMHMDGSCFSCVLKIAFIFGALGVPFSGIDTYIKVILVGAFSSVAMSGIPGGGYIGEYIACSIFFPNHIEIAYPIAITIGNLVDPPATMINSSGDYVVSFIVSRFVDGKDWLSKQFK